MSVTSGFFNSLNGDRKYNAEQMSAIFDGIINDGILANIGTAFAVSANEGLNINVGIGRAWFNSTWIYNDAILPITLDISEVLLDRIDAVVIEVDRSEAVRAASIKVVKGTPASAPQNPTMASTNYVHQYPLAYIYRTAGSSEVTQSNITNAIGTSSTPYVTGILQVQSIDNIVAQWQAQWVEWFASQTNMGEAEINQILSEWDQWYQTETTQREASMDQWSASMQAEFNQWFDALQVILEPDVATNLAAQIVELQANFTSLIKNHSIYDEILDSNGNEITDSYETTVESTTTFSYGGENILPESIGAAPIYHTHSPEDLRGAVPIHKGGTGGETETEARANLQVSRRYISIEELGLSDTTATPVAIATAMEDNSVAVLESAITAVNPTGVTSCVVIVNRKSATRVSFQAFESDGTEWIGYYNGSWLGWTWAVTSGVVKTITAGTEDLEAGTSALATGTVHLVYE